MYKKCGLLCHIMNCTVSSWVYYSKYSMQWTNGEGHSVFWPRGHVVPAAYEYKVLTADFFLEIDSDSTKFNIDTPKNKKIKIIKIFPDKVWQKKNLLGIIFFGGPPWPP